MDLCFIKSLKIFQVYISSEVLPKVTQMRYPTEQQDEQEADFN